jgi:hypothetical protein
MRVEGAIAVQLLSRGIAQNKLSSGQIGGRESIRQQCFQVGGRRHPNPPVQGICKQVIQFQIGKLQFRQGSVYHRIHRLGDRCIGNWGVGVLRKGQRVI